MTETTKIITRFAPSPTGLLHAGNYRTALFAYLYAKKHEKEGGKFLLRIEDTDKARSKEEYKDNIIEALAWLGLPYEQIVIQSERAPAHREALQKLIDSGHAYISKEEIKKEGDRAEVIRFKNPNKKVIFKDLIRGDIETDTTDLGDFIIAKSMDEPVFHLAVVSDDAFMNVSLIIRGEDHISNTPRHILIQEALGVPTPMYAHVPLVLDKDRSKLSKRKGAITITEYKKRGYLPEALVNYMALIGWNPGTDQEIFTFDELVEKFDLSKVQKSGASFDQVKLDWVNKEHMNKLSDEDFKAKLSAYIHDYCDARTIELFESLDFDKIKGLLRDRMNNFGEIKDMLGESADGMGTGELAFITHAPVWSKSNTDTNSDVNHGANPTLLICPSKMSKNGAGEKIEATPESTKAILNQVSEIISNYSGQWTADVIKEAIWPFAEHEGRGIVLWPTRVALSGKEKSPDPFSMMSILGKEETLKRLADAASAV